MNAMIQELTQQITIEQDRRATCETLIVLMMQQCHEFRESMRKQEEKLSQWRSQIAQGLRDDVEDADEYERECEEFRAEAEQFEENVQDLQNATARF